MKKVIQDKLVIPTVLVIEDNADEWFLTRYGLFCQFPSAVCTWLRDATKVASYLDQWAQTETDLPRLILLDLYLPSVQSGLRILKALKAHPFFHTTPTLVLSRSADPMDIMVAYAHSADAYVVKPAEPEEWQTVFAEFANYWTGLKRD